MMYPRLRLLHKLLNEAGILFVNLDDNEVYSCKLMLDEIFGLNNFLAMISWEKRFTRSNNAKLFNSVTDKILVYRKSGKVNFLREGRNEKSDSIYSNPDNDERGVWTSVSYVNPATKRQRKNLTYSIENPFTGEMIEHPTHAWKYSPEQHAIHVAENRLFWGDAGANKFPRLKKFLSDVDGMVPIDLWNHKDTGTTDEGSKALAEIFGDKGVFDNPKPARLIERIISLATDDNDIILDSFAGSGTTAHAVLNLNQRDGGHRKFILIEMEAYAGPITAERVKRVIDGYGTQAGTGGSFTYATVGAPLFHANNTLNEAVPVARIREYIWYSETATPLRDEIRKTKDERPEAAERAASNQYFLGSKDDSAYYFYYAPDALTTLDDAFLSTIRIRAATYIIYADTCLLSKPFMQGKGIIFKKIPRDITRF